MGFGKAVVVLFWLSALWNLFVPVGDQHSA